MTILSIFAVLFATAVMGFIGMSKAGTVSNDFDAGVDAAGQRKRALPRRWSNFLIVLTLVYFFLLLAGLSYAGWFRVA